MTNKYHQSSCTTFCQQAELFLLHDSTTLYITKCHNGVQMGVLFAIVESKLYDKWCKMINCSQDNAMYLVEITPSNPHHLSCTMY